MDCYLRIVVPPFGSTEFGQYDLRIVGDISFKGKTINNPVFSYRSDAKLYIFAADRIYENCPYISSGKNTTYEWHFTASESAKKKFASQIDAQVPDGEANYPYDASKKLLTCTVKGDYSKYVKGVTDCFSAAALWCNSLGTNALKAVFDAKSSNTYRAYLPLSLEGDGVATKKWIRMNSHKEL
ncbi:MAG: hypothetical protein Q4E13_08990 [Clostridia bacterium]|nr:hypothetical protein [Clostridia bacterium]